jgi:hypothetical protein
LNYPAGVSELMAQQQQSWQPIAAPERASSLNFGETLLCFSKLLLLMFKSRYL